MESKAPSPTSREIAEALLLDGEQRSKLVAYARSRFGIESEDAQDLVQETLRELLRQQTIVCSSHGFVFKVFQMQCCRFLRILQTQRRVFVGADEPVETACDIAALESADKRLALRQVLATISSSCRRILPYSGAWNTINRCLLYGI